MKKMKNNTKPSFKANLLCQKMKYSFKHQVVNLTRTKSISYNIWYLKKMIK